MSDLAALLARVTEGYSEALYDGKRFAVTRQTFNRGNSTKIFARCLQDQQFFSCNAYRTTQGWRLYPCEMSAESVLGFLEHHQRLVAPDSPQGQQ
ncbi:hypothetical protein [Halomonas huangheensis]|uniref:Uncharacterized protein n=1 Tax=Halomonas huangheensis TaxID=1178482 RepID=W1NAB0_9GAMM|nr:hypothetical protein [Halomonas huangheensis]ALM53641.1 hypothetical protein AR456_16185 [Halomonas huangheensis]ERL52459.1 hypothetical protein BJB45_10865 [Halomonas huangheensis]